MFKLPKLENIKKVKQPALTIYYIAQFAWVLFCVSKMSDIANSLSANKDMHLSLIGSTLPAGLLIIVGLFAGAFFVALIPAYVADYYGSREQ